MDQRYRGEREVEDLLLGLAAEMQAEHRSAVRPDGVTDAPGGDAGDSAGESGREALAAWAPADAVRLARVIRALAEAGVIDECHVVVARR